ncbi:MAG: acetyl-CoA carboxylase, biotin carboxyl carrier protein, partial [Pseudolabrys sp.]|nr:acetyl-CoA carboxylase, biotin carboxyl carrier protein [Pseudolabrys sp.]
MAKTPKASMVDHALIHELTKLLDETGLTEIEIEQDGQRVRVARGTVASAAPAPRVASAAAPQLVAESIAKP